MAIVFDGPREGCCSGTGGPSSEPGYQGPSRPGVTVEPKNSSLRGGRPRAVEVPGAPGVMAFESPRHMAWVAKGSELGLNGVAAVLEMELHRIAAFQEEDSKDIPDGGSPDSIRAIRRPIPCRAREERGLLIRRHAVHQARLDHDDAVGLELQLCSVLAERASPLSRDAHHVPATSRNATSGSSQ